MPLGAFRLNSLGKFSVTAAAEVIRRRVGIASINGAQIATFHSRIGGASTQFARTTSQYLGVYAPGSTLTLSGDYTIECWFRLNGAPVFNSNNTFWNASDHLFYLACYNTNFYELDLFTGGFNRVSTNASGNLSLAANTWYHVAFVRSGTTTKIYLSGVERGSGTWNNSIGSGGVYEIGGSPTYGFTNWFIDEFRISKTARYTSNFTPSTTAFVNDENTLLLMHMNGSETRTIFQDDNGVRSQVSAISNNVAQVINDQSRFGGGSVYFSGGERIDCIGDFSQTGNFTVECWIRRTTNGIGLRYILSIGNAANNSQILRVNGAYFQLEGFGTTGIDILQTTTTYSINTWHHLAIVRNGSTVTLYQNGTSIGSGTYSSTFGNSSNIYIGMDSAANNAFTSGWVDEVRVSNIARYTSNFTAPTAPFVNDTNTQLLLHLDGTVGSFEFYDDNGDGRTSNGITAFGNAQIDTAQSRIGGSSALFDGIDDYLRLDAQSDLNFGTNSFTIEFWARASAIGADRGIISSGSSSFVSGATAIAGGTSSWPVRFVAFDFNSSGSALVADNQAMSLNVWYHYAIVRNGNSWALYRDGTSVSTATWSGSVNLNSNNSTWIGRLAWAGGAAYSWSGWIDELRISNSARYTSNFTAPTQPFQNDANTVLLLHMDGTDATTVFIDDNGKKPI